MTRTIRRFAGPYRFLSNFHPSPFPVRLLGCPGVAPTVEHGFQAAKIVCGVSLTNDLRREWVDKILTAATPSEAKRLGRHVPLDLARWEVMSSIVMHGCLLAKFEDPLLRDALVDTGDALLVEGNTWGDTRWGVDLRTGQGQNLLGKMLMQVRDEIRAAG